MSIRIELAYLDGKIALGAVESSNGQLIARAEGAKLDETVKALISRFAEMQHETIRALNDSGIIRYIPGDDKEMS